MAKKKYRSEPKSFEQYRKEAGPTIEETESRLSPERSAPEEGEFLGSPEDVRDDYWADEEQEERENPPKEPKRRPLKSPKRIIKNWKTRKSAERRGLTRRQSRRR